MNNVLDKEKANRLRLISVARCFCFFTKRTFDHDDMFLSCCVCFSCRLRNLLKYILIERYDKDIYFL